MSTNIGIGKTSPSNKLDVVGDINVSGSFKMNGVALSNTSQWASGSSLIYYNGGKVGIGLTSPGALLEITNKTSTYDY